MLKSVTIPTCLALGMAMSASPADAQVVREGVRRTGEAAVQGSRAVAQGTRNAVNRAGEATRNVIGGTTDAARARVDRLERSQLQPGVDADFDSDVNARAQANSGQIQADVDINANPQLNGSGQASLPGQTNDPAMQGEYQSGYRGLEDQALPSGQTTGHPSSDGKVYHLRHDRNGREFICVNGRPVYFDDQQGGQPQEHEAYKLNDDQMNQQRQGQLDYEPSQYRRDAQNGNYVPQGAPPAPPAPIRSNLNSTAPASPNLNADTGIGAEQQTDLNESADVDASAKVDASADPNADADASNNASADVDVDADVDADADSSETNADASADLESDQSSELKDNDASQD